MRPKITTAIITSALLLAGVGSVPAVAGAASPTRLLVSNAGQPSFISTVPQPAVEASIGGSCPTPLEVEQANGGQQCPPGSWPTLGQPWQGPVDVAGGDRLLLEFDQTVDAVTVASTTDFPIGLVLGGQSVPNATVMAPTAALATSDGRIWSVTLPTPLDRRTITGAAFSVVATTLGVAQDFALGIQNTRWQDESARCGLALIDTGETGSPCPNAPKGEPPHQEAPPRGGPPPYEGSPPGGGQGPSGQGSSGNIVPAVPATRHWITQVAATKTGNSLHVQIRVGVPGAVRLVLRARRGAHVALGHASGRIRHAGWLTLTVHLRKSDKALSSGLQAVVSERQDGQHATQTRTMSLKLA